MAQLNKVFLMGNLTRDPELRRLPSGSAVTELGLALNRSYTGKDGEKREEVVFIDVTVWDRQAETCCQYLKKGRAVHVEGYLKMDSWEDKATGEKRSKLKVQADRVQFLDRREDGGGGRGDECRRRVRRACPSRPLPEASRLRTPRDGQRPVPGRLQQPSARVIGPKAPVASGRRRRRR